MSDKKIILFGASQLGKKALIYFNKENVAFFCDNDINKIGAKINDIEVIGFNKLLEIHKNYKIIITSMYEKEISEQLEKNNINNYGVYKENIEIYYPIEGLQEINLGQFFNKCDFCIKLDTLTFFQGGSTILDYAFLQALAKRFARKRYLEIGSFMGESVKCLSQVCDECVSISLEDKELDQLFYSKYKSNFVSYFMNNLCNVKQIKGDSKKINFKEINFEPDFVFIDGDHSYEGVFNDTQKIFDIINCDEAIVVWHDFRKAITKQIRTETVKAVFDALDENYKKNIFICDNNLCGIYIPEKYLEYFSFDINANEMYSYEFELYKVIKNLI